MSANSADVKQQTQGENNHLQELQDLIAKRNKSETDELWFVPYDDNVLKIWKGFAASSACQSHGRQNGANVAGTWFLALPRQKVGGKKHETRGFYALSLFGDNEIVLGRMVGSEQEKGNTRLERLHPDPDVRIITASEFFDRSIRPGQGKNKKPIYELFY